MTSTRPATLSERLEKAFGVFASKAEAKQKIKAWVRQLVGQKSVCFVARDDAAFSKLLLLVESYPNPNKTLCKLNNIISFTIRKNKNNGIAVTIGFKEASNTQISIKKAASGVFNQMKITSQTSQKTTPTPISRGKLLELLRDKIQNQLTSFKNHEIEANNGQLTSEYSQKIIPEKEATVDHQIIPFAKLADDWIAAQGGIEQIYTAQNDDGNWILTDAKQIKAWQDYHQSHAQLAILSQKENVSLGSYGYVHTEAGKITPSHYFAKWLSQTYSATDTVFAAARLFAKIHKVPFLKVAYYLAGNTKSMTPAFAQKLAVLTDVDADAWLNDTPLADTFASSQPTNTPEPPTDAETNAVPAATNDKPDRADFAQPLSLPLPESVMPFTKTASFDWDHCLDEPVDHSHVAHQPGKYLDAYISHQKQSYIAFAHDNGFTLPELADFLRGKIVVDESLARKLEQATMLPAAKWEEFQLAWKLRQEMEEMENEK